MTTLFVLKYKAKYQGSFRGQTFHTWRIYPTLAAAKEEKKNLHKVFSWKFQINEIEECATGVMKGN